MTEPQLRGQFATAPVGRAVGRVYALASRLKCALRFGRLRCRLPATMTTIKPTQALGLKAIAPQLHRVDAAALFPADLVGR